MHVHKDISGFLANIAASNEEELFNMKQIINEESFVTVFPFEKIVITSQQPSFQRGKQPLHFLTTRSDSINPSAK